MKLSTTSRTGREAIIAILGAGDIFGEMALAGKPVRMATATALTDCGVHRMERRDFEAALGGEESFARQFVQQLLRRNAKVLEAFLDRAFYSAEQRLARTLLEMAGLEGREGSKKKIPPISQGVLAKVVGTTRPRINLFMNRFRKLGYIKYDGGIEVSDSLRRVLLRE